MKLAAMLAIPLVSVAMLHASAQEKDKDKPQCAQDDKRPECATHMPRRSRYSPPVSVDIVPSPPPPRSPQPSISALPPPPAAARSPSTVNSCDGGGCWGADGRRYQGGTGNVYLDGAGRQCRRSGTWMQCN